MPCLDSGRVNSKYIVGCAIRTMHADHPFRSALVVKLVKVK